MVLAHGGAAGGAAEAALLVVPLVVLGLLAWKALRADRDGAGDEVASEDPKD